MIPFGLSPEQHPIRVHFGEGMLWVTLRDGRMIGTPLHWYSRLQQATEDQRRDYELWAFGIHWESLNEDLSIEGMLQAIRPRQALQE